MFVWTHDCSIRVADCSIRVYLDNWKWRGGRTLVPPLCATSMHFSAKSSSEQSISHFVESHSSILIAKMVKFYDSLEIQLDFVPHL